MKKEKIGFWMLEAIGLILILSAFFKITANPDAVTMFAAFNLSNHLLIIGLIEIVVALLLVFPQTQEIGTYTVFGYFGGAMVAHLTINDFLGLISPIVLFIMAAIALYLKDTEL